MPLFEVHVQGVLGEEGARAQRASEGPLPRVDVRVRPEVPRLCEAPSTVLAAEGTLARVDARVHVTALRCGESLVAHTAHVPTPFARSLAFPVLDGSGAAGQRRARHADYLEVEGICGLVAVEASRGDVTHTHTHTHL